MQLQQQRLQQQHRQRRQRARAAAAGALPENRANRYADSDLRSPSPPLSPNQCAPNGLALGSNDPPGSTLPRSLTGWGDEASDARRNAAPSGASAPGASAPPNPNPNP